MNNMTLMYSINTWLSYKISENYFQNRHYVWCAPHYNANGINPPSSDPYEIYSGLAKDVIGKDHHSAKISMNKSGLLKAAEIKLASKIISVEQRDEIVDILNVAQLDDFRPLIYVIPFEPVKDIVKPVSIKLKAHTFSKEYIIEQLERPNFDIIDILKKMRDMYNAIQNIKNLSDLSEIIHFTIKILNKNRSEISSEIEKMSLPNLPSKENLNIVNNLLAEIGIESIIKQDEKIDSHINSLFNILNIKFENEKGLTKNTGESILERFRNS